MPGSDNPGLWSRAASILANVLLTVATLVMLLVLGELALRLASLVMKPRFTKVDPIVGWYHTPGASAQVSKEGRPYRLSYNRMGYRGRDIPFDRAPGRPRVVFLGDSFTDGSEVGDEEVFSARLEAGLPCLDAVNLGVYSYSTAQELLTLEHVGLRYRPDLVVVVTISNDLVGNTKNFSEFGTAPRFLPSGDSLVFEGTAHPDAREAARSVSIPVPGMLFLQAHSHLYWMLNSRIYQRLRRNRIADVLREQRERFSDAQRQDLYLRLMRRMKGLADKEGMDLLVVFGYLRDELRDSVSPHAALADSLRASGIRVVDLHQPFRETLAESRDALFYEQDIHWTEAGHRLFADLIKPPIREALGTRLPAYCVAMRN